MLARPAIAPRKQPKQERARETVEAILTAAARILVREGFDAASTNRIAAKAGVSIGSLYQYFPSKEALVAALFQRHADEMLAVTRRGLAGLDAKASLRDQTRAMVRSMVAAHAADPSLHRVFMEEIPRSRRLPHLAAMDREFEELARVALERERPRIRPRNLEIAAFILVQAIEALTHAAVLHRPDMLDQEEFLDEITELIVRYLHRGPHAPRRDARSRTQAADRALVSAQTSGRGTTSRSASSGTT